MQLSPLTSSRNLAARMGRWSANHRKIAIFGWLAFVLAAIAIGRSLDIGEERDARRRRGRDLHLRRRVHRVVVILSV